MRQSDIKLSISNIAWLAEQDETVYRYMHQFHFEGVEVAPTRIFPEDPYGKLNLAELWRRELYDRHRFCIPSLQSIWYGRSENIFTSEADRHVLFDYTCRAIDFAIILGATNLVFGCPRNRNRPEHSNLDDAIRFFDAISDYAQKKGAVIALEANPPLYHTNFINTTEEALEMIETVGHPGMMLNLDLGTVIANGESVDVLKGYVHRIHHVHISEPGLKPIETREIHREVARLLKDEGYRGFVSVEMGRADSVSILADVMAYVSEIFRVSV